MKMNPAMKTISSPTDSMLPSQSKRQVRFLDNCDIIYPTICLADYTTEEIEAAFWQKEDFEDFNNEIDAIIQVMQFDSSRKRNSNTNWFCTRGLDDIMPGRIRQRQSRLVHRWDDVLDEQQEQWRQNQDDPERIALASQCSSNYPSERIAFGHGLTDEYDAFKIYDVAMMKAFNIKYDKNRKKLFKNSRKNDTRSSKLMRSGQSPSHDVNSKSPEEAKKGPLMALNRWFLAWPNNDRQIHIPCKLFRCNY